MSNLNILESKMIIILGRSIDKDVFLTASYYQKTPFFLEFFDALVWIYFNGFVFY